MELIKKIKNIFFEDIGLNNLSNREIWLKKKIEEIPNGNKILDAGAGELQYKKYCTHLNYTSQDFCQYDGTGDDKGLQMEKFDTSKIDIVGDITNIDVADDSFDAVMCIEVLEHVPNPIMAIKELTRVLKKGGKLIITAPFSSLTHFSPYHFATGFNKYFYLHHLNEKFKIMELEANGNYYDYIAQELNRMPLIAREYSKTEMSKKDKLIIEMAKGVLNKLNKIENKSDELLCYGYHLVAIKL